MSKESLWDMDWDKMIEERFGVDAETLSQYAETYKKRKRYDSPCKPGDTLYVIREVYIDAEKYILEYTCSCVDVVDNGNELVPVAISYKAENGYIDCVAFTKQQFGEKVFCSKHEAESVFKERKTEFESKIKELGRMNEGELERRRKLVNKFFGDWV